MAPLGTPDLSPFSALDRVSACADLGYTGMGFSQSDLGRIRDDLGFDRLRAHADAVGIGPIEVELASDWWLDTDASPWRTTWSLLVEAAKAFNSRWIKVGTSFGSAIPSVAPLVEPLRSLADEAAAAGTRVALEPLPFAMIASIPQGVELVGRVDHQAAGLIVDYWHVFRAGTTLDQLAVALTPSMVFGVELCDADAEPRGTLFEDTRDNRRYPGEGDQDVVGFISTMRRIGWDGPWGVEMLAAEHRARPLMDALAKARDATLRCFDEADGTAQP
ncbi:sugar phosphate isomerase/epimerase family protein [Sinomonas susongensis]|uniref:sugar phosphate isomerase/epimerase family protein n=1 Tax=Sinomonas susongensis TaxID=1324851 RepID=UPI001FEC9BDC|nr:sugar phosphate isomerase/epimerase family protein [Sinomonas susongensis]